MVMNEELELRKLNRDLKSDDPIQGSAPRASEKASEKDGDSDGESINLWSLKGILYMILKEGDQMSPLMLMRMPMALSVRI